MFHISHCKTKAELVEFSPFHTVIGGRCGTMNNNLLCKIAISNVVILLCCVWLLKVHDQLISLILAATQLNTRKNECNVSFPYNA